MFKVLMRLVGLGERPQAAPKQPIQTEQDSLQVNWNRQRAENEWFWERQAILEGKKHPSF